MPGPGSYEESNALIDVIKRKNLKIGRYKVSKREQNPNIIKLKEKSSKMNATPGPGSYIDPLDRNKYTVAPVTNSMFKSDSLRDIYSLEHHRGPGPAFYKVKDAQQQKSYNYNPKRKWL
mmetsp:Transcript_13116/g.15165  ORF Transcript_13116/g.15165 Transcript_13116/m.15165 type:complete len:119 (+) Transcript_13116:865-1221(+)